MDSGLDVKEWYTDGKTRRRMSGVSVRLLYIGNGSSPTLVLVRREFTFRSSRRSPKDTGGGEGRASSPFRREGGKWVDLNVARLDSAGFNPTCL